MSSQDSFDNKQSARNGSVIENNVNKPLPWIAIACILSSFALGISISAWILSFTYSRDQADRMAGEMKKVQMEERLTQYYVENQDATLIAVGLKKHDDTLSVYLQQHVKQEHE